jgi:hypothetical protein
MYQTYIRNISNNTNPSPLPSFYNSSVTYVRNNSFASYMRSVQSTSNKIAYRPKLHIRSLTILVFEFIKSIVRACALRLEQIDRSSTRTCVSLSFGTGVPVALPRTVQNFRKEQRCCLSILGRGTRATHNGEDLSRERASKVRSTRHACRSFRGDDRKQTTSD